MHQNAKVSGEKRRTVYITQTEQDKWAKEIEVVFEWNANAEFLSWFIDCTNGEKKRKENEKSMLIRRFVWADYWKRYAQLFWFYAEMKQKSRREKSKKLIELLLYF